MEEKKDSFTITKSKLEAALSIGLIDEKMAKILSSFVDTPELYVPVAARIRYFRENYPDWSLVTEVIGKNGENIAECTCVISNPEGRTMSTGTASRAWVNTSSHVENAETAAVGRALANLGILGGSHISSVEEVDIPEVEINSVEDAPINPSSMDRAPKAEKVVTTSEVITRQKVLERIAFFKIEKDKFNERTVSKKHTFIIRDHDKLSQKVRTAFDNLGFKITKNIYKLRIDQVEGDK